MEFPVALMRVARSTGWTKVGRPVSSPAIKGNHVISGGRRLSAHVADTSIEIPTSFNLICGGKSFSAFVACTVSMPSGISGSLSSFGAPILNLIFSISSFYLFLVGSIFVPVPGCCPALFGVAVIALLVDGFYSFGVRGAVTFCDKTAAFRVSPSIISAVNHPRFRVGLLKVFVGTIVPLFHLFRIPFLVRFAVVTTYLSARFAATAAVIIIQAWWRAKLVLVNAVQVSTLNGLGWSRISANRCGSFR